MFKENNENGFLFDVFTFEYLRIIVTPFNLPFVKAVEKNIRLELLWVLYG